MHICLGIYLKLLNDGRIHVLSELKTLKSKMCCFYVTAVLVVLANSCDKFQMNIMIVLILVYIIEFKSCSYNKN